MTVDGDAANDCPPQRAEGWHMAMEDAAVLAEELDVSSHVVAVPR